MRFWLRLRMLARLSPMPWSRMSGPVTVHLRPQTFLAATYSAAVFFSVLDLVGPVGCVALLVSFQNWKSLTLGKRLRNALKSFVYEATLGIEHGLAGQRLPRLGLNATSGSRWAAFTAAIHVSMLPGSLTIASKATIRRVRLTWSAVNAESENVEAFWSPIPPLSAADAVVVVPAASSAARQAISTNRRIW